MKVIKVYNKATKRGLRSWLADNPNPRKAIKIIADTFNVSASMILQHTRIQRISIIRIGTVYVLRRFELSEPEIGVILDRNAATIHHSLKIAETLLHECSLMTKLNALVEQLEPLLSIYRNRSMYGRRKDYFKAHNHLEQHNLLP
jgi:chromosomal replication initiation ATPase DnaA